MEEQVAELRGRGIAIEALIVTALAHISASFDDPIKFVSEVINDAEHAVGKTLTDTTQQRLIALYASQTFERMSTDMLAKTVVFSGRSAP